MKKVTYICSCCGSDQCGYDAAVRFCPDSDKWEVASIYDNSFCDGCGGFFGMDHEKSGLLEYAKETIDSMG